MTLKLSKRERLIALVILASIKANKGAKVK